LGSVFRRDRERLMDSRTLGTVSEKPR
jgi:hypothetical protein